MSREEKIQLEVQGAVVPPRGSNKRDKEIHQEKKYTLIDLLVGIYRSSLNCYALLHDVSHIILHVHDLK